MFLFFELMFWFLFLYSLILLHIFPQDPENSSSDLQKLSDAWEFQENELMHAQGRLQSIRAKLAVLEGKMALSVMYS